MSTVQHELSSPSKELLQEVSCLNGPVLDKLLDQVLVLRAERRAPHLSRQETDLLLKINTPLPEETWRRYNSLYAKLKPDTITPEEYTELKELINAVEMDNAGRIGNLIELSRLRGTTLDALMKSLGIGPRSHD